ncbi:adenosylcobinamide-GDP ribazoletransferase [Loktanella agnita]|uniref:adenosylcobinamide-GDP ribazoletransferase n=1 Tax=Loktanella agnita TaxID=287097 RepID=UPI003988D4DB
MRDTGLISWIDLPAALGLLTRLPIPVDAEEAAARGARAAWAYPLVGALIGVFVAACIPLLLMTGLPGGMVGAVVLAVSVIITGAMHEDGLADSADGLWGGWDRERRLAIMKDSHIGVYGVIAIGFSLLIRWLALVALVATGQYWSVLIAIATLSRLAMVVVMGVLPQARAGGLSAKVGQPSVATMVVALILSVALAMACNATVLIFAAALAALACGVIARFKIGGQTGDILGATQQVTEIVLLMVVVASLN